MTVKLLSPVKIQPASDEQWKQIRFEGVGASEIGTLLGVNPYQTPFQLWQLKTGKTPPFEGNKFTDAGHYLEPAVAQYYQDKTGNRIIKSSAADIIFRHPEFEFAQCTPDREYFKTGGGRGLLECKTTQKIIDPEDVPQSWFCQLQYQLGICQKDTGAIAWLSRGIDFDFKEWDFNREFFDFMIEKATTFWTYNVMGDIPPAATRSSDIELMFEKHAAGKYLEATPELYQLHTDLKAITATEKEIKEQKDTIQEQIKLTLRESEGAKYKGETLCTWKTPKVGEAFDKKALLRDHPAIYAKYITPKQNSRRFLLK